MTDRWDVMGAIRIPRRVKRQMRMMGREVSPKNRRLVTRWYRLIQRQPQ